MYKRQNLGRAFDEAIPYYEKALAGNPGAAELRSQLGYALANRNRVAEALAQWRQALRQEPDNLRVLNDIAWMLATCADDAIRNGTEAVALAEHAVEIASGHQPSLLATLAAAYAEAGRFDKAVEFETRAIDLATWEGNAPLAATLRTRLAQLQAKAPIR